MEANKTDIMNKYLKECFEIHNKTIPICYTTYILLAMEEYANQPLLEKDKEIDGLKKQSEADWFQMVELENKIKQLQSELSELKEKRKEELQKSFTAGCRFQEGEQKSWETYNELTGSQKPNKEMNFEQYYTQTYGQ